MVWRKRTLAAGVLVVVAAAGVLLGRGAQVAGQASPSVTLNGQSLEAGTREVPPRPAMGLLLPPGSRASDFRASIDGRAIPVAALVGRAARLDVGELPQGSHHRLEVWRGSIGPAHVGSVAVDFQVVEPLKLAASWLASSAQTTVQVSASGELADVSVVQAALARAGATVRRDDRGVEGRWPPGEVRGFTVAAGLRATTGAFLPADFSPASGPPAATPTSRVDLSQPLGPRPTGLRLRAYYVAGPGARAALAHHAPKISVLSPAFYAANADGTLTVNVDEQALALAKAGAVSLEPLVTNRDFSGPVARDLFRNGSAVDALGAALVAEARRRGFAGFQLDFEGLGFGDKAALSAFSAQLSRHLRGAGLNYSTAVIPTKDVGGGGLAQLFGHSGVYDYPQLARDATSMSVMSYDQHTSSTDPGPVAGLDWVRQVAQASTARLDRSRVFLGVPLYYRDWPLRGAASAGAYTDLVADAAAHDGTVAWDFATASPYARYQVAAEEHVAWMENQASLLAKLQLAKQLGFGGIAAWRIGLEDPTFWDLW